MFEYPAMRAAVNNHPTTTATVLRSEDAFIHDPEPATFTNAEDLKPVPVIDRASATKCVAKNRRISHEYWAQPLYRAAFLISSPPFVDIERNAHGDHIAVVKASEPIDVSDQPRCVHSLKRDALIGMVRDHYANLGPEDAAITKDRERYVVEAGVKAASLGLNLSVETTDENVMVTAWKWAGTRRKSVATAIADVDTAGIRAAITDAHRGVLDQLESR